MYNTSRDTSIDIAKGIGIILVVFGHINASAFTTIQNFIYQFHVLLFFFISGMFVSIKKEFRTLFINRVQKLYVPAVFWLTIFYIILLTTQYTLHESHIDTNDFIKHNILQLAGLRVNQLGGGIWFLFSLFKSSLLMSIALTYAKSKHFKEVSILFVLSTIAWGIGFFVRLPYNMEKDFIALFFLCIGKLYYLSGIHYRLQITTTTIKFLIVFVCFGSILITSTINKFDIGLGLWGSPLITTCSSIIGTTGLICFSDLLICNFKYTKALEYVGTHSIWILIGHFVGFKFVIAAQIIYTHSSINNIFCHPTFMAEGGWILLYLASGIFVPLAALELYKYLTSHLNFNEQ